MYIPSDTYKIILERLPVLCVDVLIIYQEKCLLLLRDNEPAKGQYWFPGGRINKNELIRDAALRKAKEETGLDCSFVKTISAEESLFDKNDDMLTDVHTVNICCLLSVIKIDNIALDHLHSGFKWINQLDKTYHQAVNNPLSLIGFNF